MEQGVGQGGGQSSAPSFFTYNETLWKSYRNTQHDATATQNHRDMVLKFVVQSDDQNERTEFTINDFPRCDEGRAQWVGSEISRALSEAFDISVMYNGVRREVTAGGEWLPMSELENSTLVFDVWVREVTGTKVSHLCTYCSVDSHGDIYRIENMGSMDTERNYFDKGTEFLCFRPSDFIAPEIQATDAKLNIEFGG